jgi:hypothetical protein
MAASRLTLATRVLNALVIAFSLWIMAGSFVDWPFE